MLGGARPIEVCQTSVNEKARICTTWSEKKFAESTVNELIIP